MTGLTSTQIMHNAWISGLFQELVDGGVMAEGVAVKNKVPTDDQKEYLRDVLRVCL